MRHGVCTYLGVKTLEQEVLLDVLSADDALCGPGSVRLALLLQPHLLRLLRIHRFGLCRVAHGSLHWASVNHRQVDSLLLWWRHFSVSQLTLDGTDAAARGRVFVHIAGFRLLDLLKCVSVRMSVSLKLVARCEERRIALYEPFVPGRIFASCPHHHCHFLLPFLCH